MSFAVEPDYLKSLEAYRQDRLAKLTADEGWLTVAGLHWMREGVNGDVRPDIGVFDLRGRSVRFTAAPGVAVLHRGQTVREAELKPDTEGGPDRIRVGGVSMFVIERGTRFGIRITDAASEFRRDFKGLRYFPVDPSMRVEARFVAYEAPKRVPIVNILGDTEQMESPGYAEFEIAGKPFRLACVKSGARLFIIFRDQTSGKETYGAARFLYADPAVAGRVTLDFNRAENPPCAFIPYGTCPLPPRENHLPIAIRAGELKYP